MAKKQKKQPAAPAKAKKPRPEPIRELIVPKNATKRQIYAIMRKAFTAADLQKYTEPMEGGVPAEQVLAELEAIQRKFEQSKNGLRPNRARPARAAVNRRRSAPVANKKKLPASNKGKRTKIAGLPILDVPKNATRRQIYAAVRKAFTAADLQKYTEIEEGVPIETVLADLEAIHREETRKKKRK